MDEVRTRSGLHIIKLQNSALCGLHILLLIGRNSHHVMSFDPLLTPTNTDSGRSML